MFFHSLILSIVLSASALAQEMRPFVLPWDDASASVTDLSGWSHRPAGKFGPVRIGEDAHLYAGDERVRFWGVNIGPETIFTRIDKPEDRDAFAARLSKFGFNAVRFHHMGANWTLHNIFGGNPNAKTTEIDTESFARFAAWFEAFKRHGLYTNLNLLVSRRFRAADGLPAGIDNVQWKDQHVIGFWDERMLELQKAYAKQMLTTPMPGSGTPLVDDPALAIVEINNENGLIHAWLGGAIERLPATFTEPLRGRWNAWLAERHDDDAKLAEAWRAVDQAETPLFPRDDGEWVLERHGSARAELSHDAAAASVRVEQPGEAGWHVQINHAGFGIQKGKVYTLRYSIKADRERDVAVNVRRRGSPWDSVGLQASPRIGAEWQAFEHAFLASDDEPNAQVTFSNLSQEGATFEVKDVMLSMGGKMGLPGGATLAARSIPLLRRDQHWGTTGEAKRDFVVFLHEVEREYWIAMRDYLKKDLGVKAIVIGTIAQCSPVTIQAEMDAIDTHAYWQHPRFTKREWDPEHWTVGNVSMVNEADGGNVTSLAMYAIEGKPHFVTEYDHPAPNPHAGEAPLFIAAYAALQDWDGVFTFVYGGERETWDRGRVDSFFDWLAHPTKMANAVHAAAMFRRGDVAAAREIVSAKLTPERELDMLATKGSAWVVVNANTLGVDRTAALNQRTRISLGDQPAVESDPATDQPAELRWDVSTPDQGVVVIDTPRTKGLIGYIGGRTVRAGQGQSSVYVQMGKDAGWVTVMLTLTEGESFDRPKRALLTVAGRTENTNMGWKDDTHTSVGQSWGSAPSLVETPGFSISFEWTNPPKLYALDGRGQRTQQAFLFTSEAGVVSTSLPYSVGGALKGEPTIWYEIVWE